MYGSRSEFPNKAYTWPGLWVVQPVFFGQVQTVFLNQFSLAFKSPKVLLFAKRPQFIGLHLHRPKLNRASYINYCCYKTWFDFSKISFRQHRVRWRHRADQPFSLQFPFTFPRNFPPLLSLSPLNPYLHCVSAFLRDLTNIRWNCAWRAHQNSSLLEDRVRADPTRI